MEPVAAAGRGGRRRAGAGRHRRHVADDLAAAVAEADIVSTATLSSEPLVRGAWLKPGTHLDCVGAFKPTMRETDDEAARRARIFVDTRAGAFAEAGDILQPLQAGVIGKEAVLGELAELCRGAVQGRTSPEEITLFKSVGASIEDLAAAWRSMSITGPTNEKVAAKGPDRTRLPRWRHVFASHISCDRVRGDRTVAQLVGCAVHLLQIA